MISASPRTEASETVVGPAAVIVLGDTLRAATAANPRSRRTHVPPRSTAVSSRAPFPPCASLCNTMSYMKSSTLTLRLDPELDSACSRSWSSRPGRSRSELAREALRRQLTLVEFEQQRRRVLPFAEARGYLTDEDIFRDIS